MVFPNKTWTSFIVVIIPWCAGRPFVSYHYLFGSLCTILLPIDAVYTRRCVIVVRTPASCGGSTRFESRPRSRDWFCDFFSSSRHMLGLYLKIGHDRFIPHPFQFAIHSYLFHLTHYNLCVENDSKNHFLSDFCVTYALTKASLSRDTNVEPHLKQT